MKIEVSIGEIVDKLSILQIKTEEIKEESDFLELVNVNKKLWVIEDDIRDKERSKEFDNIFVELARAVYVTNDERAEVKKKINLKYGSEFVEEKSYNPY